MLTYIGRQHAEVLVPLRAVLLVLPPVDVVRVARHLPEVARDVVELLLKKGKFVKAMLKASIIFQ